MEKSGVDVHLPLPEVVALALAACFFLDVAIFLVAQLYSRFVFDRYLKKNHRQKWEELVRGSDNWGPNLGGFDRTRQMHKFRTQSKEDLGDPSIRKMRKISIYLTNAGIMIFLGLLGFLFTVVIVDRLLQS